VWSVGAKNIEVYLAVGLALLKAPGKPLVSLSHAPTVPLQAVFAQVQALALEQGISLRNRATNVCLSARYAPGCVLPPHVNGNKGVVTEAEQHRFVSAKLNIPSNNLRIQMNTDSLRFVAAITQGHMKALEDWALSNGARLQGVQPLWSVVTQAHRAQPASVKAVVLIEPDGVSLLAQPSSDPSIHAGQIFEMSTSADVGGRQLQVKQWQEKLQMAQQETAIFCFRESAAFRSEPGLNHWLGHWELA
jgi:hypothetical protein